MATRWICLAVAGCVGLAGCAQISVSSELRTVPVAGARPLSVERRVVERQLEVRWLQRGDSLTIELIEHRRCQAVERVAAVREEQQRRRADGAIYWEYGAAAVLLGLAAFSFARPDLFAVPEATDAGEKRSPSTGYALGGVFAGLGAGALGVSIYDSVRARDRVLRADTVMLRPGPAVECDAPSLPASQRRLELLLGDSRSHGVTDLEGRARFLLPAPALWPEVAEEPAPELDGVPTRAPTRRWAGVLKVGSQRSVAVEVVLPYEQTAAVPNTGAAISAPG
ncbi:MAG: hypothetical protein JNK56_02545 [Myxococcales bacterium]|nr:hypothetical protein [Myxococcales bacterium]